MQTASPKEKKVNMGISGPNCGSQLTPDFVFCGLGNGEIRMEEAPMLIATGAG
jgi:hypothetical protein